MHAYLIATLVILGLISLLDVAIFFVADPRKEAPAVALLHIVPLVMAIVACAVAL